jgi:hypothetical protein
VDDQENSVRLFAGQESFLFSIMAIPAVCPTQPPIQLELEAFTPREKLQEHEADHSLPFSAKVKNGGNILPLPIPLQG